MDATTVAVDVAKTVFEVAVADRQWHIVARHRFNRRQFTHFLSTASPARVVMEACGTAHYWGRCAQRHGHTVTLLPPAYVRPYVRRNKTDRTDAEALLEAVRSGQIPAVPVKTVAQQTLVGLHRIRDQWMTTRTARINTVRGLLREQGILLPAGAEPAVRAIPALVEGTEAPLSGQLGRMLALIYEEIRQLEDCISRLERELRVVADADPVIKRLREIPGIGLLTSTALMGLVGSIHTFHRARQFSSWLGLTPREYSSGARRRLGGISKRGDVYLRCLLTHGARAVLRSAHRRTTAKEPLTRLHQWALTVQSRRGHNKAAIAVANKLGRVVWAVWHHDQAFAAASAA